MPMPGASNGAHHPDCRYFSASPPESATNASETPAIFGKLAYASMRFCWSMKNAFVLSSERPESVFSDRVLLE